VDDPLVQEQLAQLPSMGAELDTELRTKRLREVLQQLPPKCQAADGMTYF
jgi:hypothetical protein